MIFVVSGEMWCGERHCPAGTHVELPLGAAFGPFVAGPEGTVLLEVMMGDPRSWGDDPDVVPARPGATGRRGPPRSADRPAGVARGPALPNWAGVDRAPGDG